MHRAPFLVWLSFGLIVSPAIAGAQSDASRAHSRAVSEDHAALPYQVHIAPTSQPDGSSSIETGGDSWAARGYDLRTLIAQIFNVDARRIDFPDDAMASRRFDISVSLPVEVDDSTMQRLLADAVQKRFGLKIAPESRPMDVYVLTAPNGPGAAMKRHFTKMTTAELTGFTGADSSDDLGKVTVFGQDCTDKGSSTGISVEASSISDFRRTLEGDLDRVLLDETHLAGSFDFTVGNYTSQQQLFQVLHDQLGLVITPAERNVTVLAVRPADAQSAQTMQARL
ncbi:MAG TPA: TIGR03435 family protein [Acidobacteriaceae bacterium]|nr:TIGR03435 family protein [Acidobacteriaceae bacterium]